MTLRQRLRELVFAPASAIDLGAARILLAATGLWMLLSRYGLVSVLTFPDAMWDMVAFTQRLRFFYVFPYRIEEILYVVAHVSLVAALLGIWSGASCFISALLLYHFAPLEAIFWTTNPYLRGFTIPILGLFILAFSRSADALAVGRKSPPPPHSSEYGWPLFLIRLFFAEIYFFAGYSKIFATGLAWLRPDNIRRYLVGLDQVFGYPAGSLSSLLAEHPVLCGAIALIGVVFDLAFPIVLVSRFARWVMIPVALLFHIANVVLFHIAFQNTVLLLLFIDWGRILSRRNDHG